MVFYVFVGVACDLLCGDVWLWFCVCRVCLRLSLVLKWCVVCGCLCDVVCVFFVCV